ncbi:MULTISPECIES: DUF6902 family protein [Rhodobacterales]|jgi:hypothetical protein|uniref:DUF6902 family protein n=1 Tax=Rhodobacterales TaxID=204455 RepID=UPI00237F84E4|nr:hypothetical protein [Phaeobacter gallaeciensis]MDE4138976.1 hypothetical protein [Phaeobacter gallaeciensis]MDE4147966.1 hypothetical protein [Phaeobacter gallaeciensis]MDE4152184.1 hypothetical protein [Phaeobacter gallaeciensis]MDE4227032.1 hypothetical protein [Phaeobacter gallaeciensis]MDE4256648.1 hypothetical protein [Phaeobacter gallaeciensis]
MAQVLAFPTDRIRPPGGNVAVLSDTFAGQRRSRENVFWLKENAELLNILECTGAEVPVAALAPFEAFYETAERRLSFFRQYYRFILSICLDLEDLGVDGGKGEEMAAWVEGSDLVGAELSDLQRAEARRLLARRGIMLELPGLDQRLHDFIETSQTFALPNKKAGYELTHIVFYLSEYGRRDPGLSRAALRSLEYAGVVSFLDQDADLLAEVCIALRYAGGEVPMIWEDWLAAQTDGFAVIQQGFTGGGDDYHCYFVCNWLRALTGGKAFDHRLPQGATHLKAPEGAGVLRSLSMALYEADVARGGDWALARDRLASGLDPAQRNVLAQAENSCACFGQFFEGFLRSGHAGRA